jgi:hypothetical protein
MEILFRLNDGLNKYAEIEESRFQVLEKEKGMMVQRAQEEAFS